MIGLKYEIGGLEINPERIQHNLLGAAHLFIVQASGDSVLIYVAESRRHKELAEKFGLKGNIIGGGSLYTTRKKRLVLDDYSYDYGAIPREAAQNFAELISPELSDLCIEINGIVVNPYEKRMNSFWRKKGFSPQ